MTVAAMAPEVAELRAKPNPTIMAMINVTTTAAITAGSGAHSTSLRPNGALRMVTALRSTEIARTANVYPATAPKPT